MDFELSEENKLIKDTARRIAREVVAPRAKELDETGEYPHDYFDAFKKAGLLGMAIPESMGGTGNGILPLCLAIEEVAKYECGAGLMLVLSGLPTRPIMFGGTPEQQQKFAEISKGPSGVVQATRLPSDRRATDALTRGAIATTPRRLLGTPLERTEPEPQKVTVPS